MTEEHKLKIQEGRIRVKEEKLANGEINNPVFRKSSKNTKNGLPICYISGNEENAFDFYTAVRLCFRSRKDYISSEKILKEISDKVSWNNISWVKTILSKYVYLMVVHACISSTCIAAFL